MLAILRPDFSSINRTEFPLLKSPGGQDYFRINFNLVMTFDTIIEFKLEYKGTALGSHTRRIDRFLMCSHKWSRRENSGWRNRRVHRREAHSSRHLPVVYKVLACVVIRRRTLFLNSEDLSHDIPASGNSN